MLHAPVGTSFLPMILGLSLTYFFHFFVACSSICTQKKFLEISFRRRSGKLGFLIKIPAAKFSSILLLSTTQNVLEHVIRPARLLPLIKLSYMSPSLHTITIPSQLPQIQLSSITSLSSPSSTKMPSDFEFSMQLYFILVLPESLPPKAILAFIFESILLLMILALDPSTIKIPQLKFYAITLGFGKDLTLIYSNSSFLMSSCKLGKSRFSCSRQILTA